MSTNYDLTNKPEQENYGELFKPERTVYVIKKDGSKEAFNVQKVVSAVGKSAYRALTKFTEEDKKHITLFGMYGAYASYYRATSSS